MKVEPLFKTNTSKNASKCLKVLIGMDQRRKDPRILHESGSAERLNKFYATFDDKDYCNSMEQNRVRDELRVSVDNYLFLLQEDVVRHSLNKSLITYSANF